MQLTCPHCGEPILAENINIQRMVAVCSACHHVFQFDPAASTAKLKQRKVKPPVDTSVIETDSGEASIAFRTNFLLERNEAFILSVLISGISTFVTLVLATSAATRAPVLPFSFGLFTLMMYYIVALQVFNRTHIEIDDEQIKISRQPLPNIFSAPNTIDLAGVELVRYEETAASRKEGYDTPRYNVWAETVDGQRKLVVGDVISEYAIFVSQWLNERLNSEPDVDNLIEADEVQNLDEFVTQAKSLRG